MKVRYILTYNLVREVNPEHYDLVDDPATFETVAAIDRKAIIDQGDAWTITDDDAVTVQLLIEQVPE